MLTWTIIFLLFRKNTKMLKDFVNERGENRKRIIEIKASLSFLSSAQYNLIKAICTDLDRFEASQMEYTNKRFSYEDMRVDLIHPETNTLYKVFDSKYHVPLVLHDKELNIYFIIESSTTIVNNIELFVNEEHKVFKLCVEELIKVKVREKELIKQQQQIKEDERKLEERQSILSKYQ